MDQPVEFTIFILFSFVVILASGVLAVQKLTVALEGRYEFIGDSLTKRSRFAGISLFFLWALLASVNWSFAFDWFLSGSVDYAFERLGIKILIIFELLEAFGND
jgi:hypothetical protein